MIHGQSIKYTTLSRINDRHCATPRYSGVYHAHAMGSEQGFVLSATGTYYSPNCSRPVEIPPLPTEESPKNPFTSGRGWVELRGPSRWTKAYGWTSFIPLERCFHIHPFDVLSRNPSIVYDPRRKQYSLHKSTIATWDALSFKLIDVVDRLGALYSIPAVRAYSPRGWKYHEPMGSRERLVAAVHQARDWFMVWAGLIAFMLRFAQSYRPMQSNREERIRSSALPPHWRVVLKEMECKDSWIDGLEAIAFLEWVPRTGVVFDDIFGGPSPTEDVPKPAFWYEAGVPIWFLWNDSMNDHPLPYNFPTQMLPSHRVDTITSLQLGGNASSYSSSSDPQLYLSHPDASHKVTAEHEHNDCHPTGPDCPADTVPYDESPEYAVESLILEDLRCFFGYVEPSEMPDATLLERWSLAESEQAVFARCLGYALKRPGVAAFMERPKTYWIWRLWKAFASSSAEAEVENLFDLRGNREPDFTSNSLFRSLRVIEPQSTLDGARRFFIFVNEATGVHYGVSCPAVALGICRLGEKYGRGRALLQRLVEMGVHVHTFATLRSGPVNAHEGLTDLTPPANLLPHKPAQYIFTPEDYENYRSSLHAKLQNPRMRAAALRGGFIWRLSIGVVEEDVIHGPPQGNEDLVIDVEGRDERLFDDALTPDEHRALVGTYLCATGSGKEEVPKSWWPPVHVFESEGCGEAYFTWNDYREQYYLDRRVAIHEGKAQPMTADYWRGALRGRKELRNWKKAVIEKSEAFIKSRKEDKSRE
ncbi:hypothetical protein NMY22_g15602 [Coprinellus aureogranulatus]|nr:hypothetical protein NMY22_g15602 [Coprinellus aureogranulatus]